MNVLNFDDLKVTTKFTTKTKQKKQTINTLAEIKTVESFVIRSTKVCK